MIRRLSLIAAAVTAISLATPIAPAHAANGDVIAYDTVDSIEAAGGSVKITGIIAGDSAATTKQYSLGSVSDTSVAGARCDRLALLAMSKPGKYRFEMMTVYSYYNCKLSLRTP